MLKFIFKFTSIAFMLISSVLYSQQKSFNGDPDAAFETARKMAFDGQRKQAQDTLLLLLTKYPDYLDIRDFLASTYAWDGNYESARKEFKYVLQKDSDRQTTWVAAINNELWAEVPFSALKMTKEALTYFPNDEELLLLKARAEANSLNPKEALITVDALLKSNPNNQKAIEYKESLSQELRFNAIGFTYNIDLYSEVFDPMQYYTLDYSRQTKYGSIIARVNFNRRFQNNGLQFEVDLYPRIMEGLYAYLNFGFSDSYLFPKFRFGAELYKSLPRSFEVSLGLRTLKYSSTTNIYTGSVGWYTGNSYLSLRPYITPGDTGTSISGTLTYRLYRSDANNYFGVAGSMGYSPDDYEQFNDGNTGNKKANFDSQRIRFGYYFTSNNRKNAWGAQAGVTHQEISFDQGNFFWIYSLGVSWELKFK
ncbi:YaiO family outer membrane beta-barrel protein [Lutibacter sp. HS1-25]|uniref:YaiO family outer membrane beta-barrel protein n=1 Tax=Lutibacter sp. HS1-25 TaxID=2485000 RepID=UPI001010B370|nr:YaiO family outer membrane beta-barrel protein [Lutibacter sp. HS1-25]RXP63567.1 YaiO family outer membrane beta-barrel protein [Lutibacter sp. HS1-25]